MEDVVNIADSQARDLPARIGYALAVRELITLAGSTLLAGAGGLDQIVARVNVIEVPDILPWVKPASRKDRSARIRV
jgi:purine catabolism regulator